MISELYCDVCANDNQKHQFADFVVAVVEN